MLKGRVRIVLGVSALASLGFLSPASAASNPADYRWSSSHKRAYRIVTVARQQRPQPEIGSRKGVRDYLRATGVGCRRYQEAEPSEEDIFTLGGLLGHEWATCVGIDHYWLMVFSDSSDKHTWVESFAGCKAVAPYKPAYFLEGPNWTVSLQSDVSTDDITTTSNALRTASAVGARLQRSCAPSPSYPGIPIRSVTMGEPFTMANPKGLISDWKAHVVVESAADPAPGGDGGPASAGYRLIAVTYAFTNSGSVRDDTSFLWAGLHTAGAEMYFEPRSEDAASKDTATTANPRMGPRVTLVFEVPATLIQPTLRLSPADDAARPVDLVDVALNP